MPSFRSFGSLDDQPLIDGDAGFVGMNQREQPNQLKAGEVYLSKNGRIDGYWQPRRGIDLKSGQFANSLSPLLLPFIVIDTPIAISTGSRTSNVVTINLASAHGIDSGDLPAYVTLGTPSVSTNPITGIPPGSYLMSYVDADSLSFADTGADDPTLTIDATYGKIASMLDDTAIAGIYGSCVWSNPASNLEESILLATNSEAKRVSLSDYTITSIPYPNGVGVSGEADMIQAFDRIYLFREGQRTLEYIPAGRAVESGDYTSVSGIVEFVLRDHGLTAGDSITIADVGFVTTDPNGTHTVTTIVDADTFQYVIATGSGNETYTAGTGTMTAAGFTLVPAGAYSALQYFNIAGNAYGVASGVVRFTVVGNTSIRAGDTITIRASDVALLSPVIGERFIVTAATATDIYFNAPLPDLTYAAGSGTEFVEFGSRYSLGLGFTHMPAPAWGVYFQRRLWCPFAYNQSGTNTAPTYTDRETRDEIAASDILDPNTFDSVQSQFRVTAGIADYLVGMHPFYDDSMLVFNRNSVHLIAGTQGTLSDTVLRELTREVGCVARRSIASQGNQIFFLSDDGIYGLSFIDQYNLRGVDEPLSKPIQPYINRINKRLASGSIGIYFDNRYRIAVPLDSSVGADDAHGNNAVLIYNMLNKAWESVDSYGSDDFFVTNMLRGQSGERNDLYIVNDNGGLHLSDVRDEAQDNYSTDFTGGKSNMGIDYEMKSRGYSFNDYGRKKFSRATVQLQSSQDNSSDVAFRFATEDPDTVDFEVTDVGTMLDVGIGLPGVLPANESGDFSFRLGNPRGIYGVLTIKRKIVGSTALGRPKVASIAMEATNTSRQTITQY